MGKGKELRYRIGGAAFRLNKGFLGWKVRILILQNWG